MVVDPAPTPETHLTHGFHVMQRNPAGSFMLGLSKKGFYK
jgi:hypothetical protein